MGTVCWGHISDVTEDNIRTFTGNWTGTGSIEGTGDGEKLVLGVGQYMESEIVESGVYLTTLLQNEYAAGDTVVMKYRFGNSQAACLADTWKDYTVPFQSTGFVQVRMEATT